MARAGAVNIADLEVGGYDRLNAKIHCFYGRDPPDYAVYRTPDRVAVQFADAKATADVQRKAMARLNPLRGEINGLIDGWRKRRWLSDRRARRAQRFDRRVGDALVVAFEDDVPDAEILLGRIKQDILNERIAWGRFQYLLAAFAVGCAVILAVLAFSRVPLCRGQQPLAVAASDHVALCEGNSLLAAAAAGAAGAFFSIAIGIRGRTVLPDLLWITNAMDAGLRVTIGVIGGAVLIALINLKLVELGIGGAHLKGADGGTDAWLSVLIVGFVAGFTERLVPDLLDKAAAKPVEPPPPRRDADRQPAAGKTKDTDAVAGAAATAKAEVDPTPDADVDHCLCDVHQSEADATPDEHLPAATGGVAKPDAP